MPCAHARERAELGVRAQRRERHAMAPTDAPTDAPTNTPSCPHTSVGS